MKLRPYQEAGVRMMLNELRAHRTALCTAATAAGKTEMFIEITRQAQCKTAVLVGRDKLVQQTARRMRSVLSGVSVWSAGQGEKTIGDTTVVSVHSADTLTIPDLRLLIIDEAHNVNGGRYTSFIERHPNVRIAGFTATPWRNSVPIYGESELFKSVTYNVGMMALIKQGFLVPPVSKAMPEGFDVSKLTVRAGDFVMSELAQLTSDRSKIIAQVKDAIPRLIDRNKIVWTCTTIEHAEAVGSMLVSMGESAVVIHSKVPDIDYAMECFEKGPFRHAVSVMMLTEGIDIPSVDGIVLMRPTRSPTLMVQTIGRGLRLYDGKKDCVILDYGQTIANCGPVNAPYIKERRTVGTSKEKFTPTIRVCPSCLNYVPIDLVICPDCGHEDKRVVDRLAALQRKAASDALLIEREPATYEVSNVSVGKHRAASGNDCVKLSFSFRGRISLFHIYGSSHSYSWGKMEKVLYRLTPFRFKSFREAWDNVDSLDGSLDIPKTITIKLDGQYEKFVSMQT